MRSRPIPVFLALAFLLSSLPCLAADKVLPADGRSLWSHLKASDYKKTFSLWPGVKEFAKGKSQHGSLTTIYLSRGALDALNGKQGEMPLGALIVKENYDEGKVLQNITIMYKARSYNPSAGNWFWAKYSPSGEIEMEGRVKPCIGCHQDQKTNDYICNSSLK